MSQSQRHPSLFLEYCLLDDGTLAARAQARDEQAFTTLYERYFNKIALYLTRIVGKDTIGSELTQETFFRAWCALPNLQEPKAFVGWL
jgi:DNA-directed RNA polymerase specialized sigma24 family protein